MAVTYGLGAAKRRGLPGCVCVTELCAMIVLWARVSNNDQTTAHQVTQAEAAQFKINQSAVRRVRCEDSPCRASPGEAPVRHAGDTPVVCWADRLGRNYIDVVDTIRDFMRRDAIIRTVITGMTFDGSTTDPMQCAVRDALIAFMAATGAGTGRGYQVRSTGRHLTISAERNPAYISDASRPMTELRSSASPSCWPRLHRQVSEPLIVCDGRRLKTFT